MTTVRRIPLSLLPALAVALKRRLFAPLRVWRRRTWLYRRLLGGPLSDRVVFYPYDASPRRLEDADAMLRGRFRFAGETVEIKEGSIFEKAAPSEAWFEQLHAFQWLPALSAAGGDASRTLATNLISQWLKRYSRYAEPAWRPDIMARRLLNLFCHGRLVLTNSDMLWRSKVFVSLREQSRMLVRIARECPDGPGRLEVAAVIAISGACLDHSEARLTLGLKLLEEECARQILPDGGHIGRAPEALLSVYRNLTMVMDALTATGHTIPLALRATQDRMAPMLRFFRHSDGALALFNGGHEGDARAIAGLLARDEVRGQPFGHARHSGYQRLAAAKTLIAMDCGAPPPLAFAAQTHAGCLAFEMSADGQRIVVNCGAGGAGNEKWDDVLSATAAHSTLTLADTSSGAILPQGWTRHLLGPRLIDGPRQVTSDRNEAADGLSVQARHDGYLSQFGMLHERKMTLSSHGDFLAGVDRVIPQTGSRRARESIPFAIRFHIHPDVRMSPSQGGDFILKLPGGEGWRFRASGGQAFTEESIYLGSSVARRSEQLVVSGAVKDTPVEIAWTFEQISTGAAP